MTHSAIPGSNGLLPRSQKFPWIYETSKRGSQVGYRSNTGTGDRSKPTCQKHDFSWHFAAGMQCRTARAASSVTLRTIGALPSADAEIWCLLGHFSLPSMRLKPNMPVASRWTLFGAKRSPSSSSIPLHSGGEGVSEFQREEEEERKVGNAGDFEI